MPLLFTCTQVHSSTWPASPPLPDVGYVSGSSYKINGSSHIQIGIDWVNMIHHRNKFILFPESLANEILFSSHHAHAHMSP